MKETLISILSCPVCRGSLTRNHKDSHDNDEQHGSLVCEKCAATYSVKQDLPRLYLDDDGIIERSGHSKHSEYILDRNRIDVLVRTTRKRTKKPSLDFFYKRVSILAIIGWILLAVSGLLIITRPLALGGNQISIAVLILIAAILFVADFQQYRKIARKTYEYQVHRLAQLSRSSVLSEFDIHQKRQSKNETDFDISEDQRKAEEIARRLDKYRSRGKRGLNVGCGGEQHQLTSKPFFDRGYDMIGLDVCEDYVSKYCKLFQASAVQANAMALPFANDSFDIVNFCDVLEHLHHPFLGLCEVNRVLKAGGLVILSTNCRCRLSRECANPLILLERLISVYFDGVLGPRDMLRRFDDMEFYHLNFSKREIAELLESSGFEVLEFYTYLSKRRVLTKVFSRVPVLRFMGDAIVVTCRKRIRSAV
jgi:ubiquinone/menaquinone biosynthesis C-methylase UbiE/uncharacterized protein YbaR (Trm112 family)